MGKKTWQDGRTDNDAVSVTAARDHLRDLERTAAVGVWVFNLLTSLAGEEWRPPGILADALRWEKVRLREILKGLHRMGIVEDSAAGYRLTPLGDAVYKTWE